MGLNAANPVFITGFPRSGTTLLSVLLNKTGKIYIPEETHAYQLFYEKKFGNFVDFYFNENRNKYLKYLNLGKNTQTLLKSKIENNTPKELVELICMDYAQKKGVSRWGEKTPFHYKYIREILSDFRDARIIHLIRDPRDVINSIREANWKARSCFQRTEDWMKQFTYLKVFENDNRVLVIRYEDLLQRFRDTYAKILAHAGIDMTMSIGENKGTGFNFDVTKEPWKMKSLDPPDPANCFKWKQGKNQIVNKSVSYLTRTHLIPLGYELYPETFTIPGTINISLYLMFQHFSSKIILYTRKTAKAIIRKS
jgi:hypothetical protein